MTIFCRFAKDAKQVADSQQLLWSPNQNVVPIVYTLNVPSTRSTPNVLFVCIIPKVPSTYTTCQKLVIQVLKALYGLKQSGKIWYQNFIDKLIAMGFAHEEITLCLLIKHYNAKFVIMARIMVVYIDDLNIFGTPNITKATIHMLK